MSWTRFASLIPAVALVAVATTSHALDRDYGRSGPYLNAGGTYAFEDFSGNASDANPDDSWGYFLRGGYRFNEYFALELNIDHFIGFDEGGGGGDTEIFLVGANGKFYPFHGIFQPYVLVGGGWTKVDPSASTGEDEGDGAAIRFAGGVEVYVTRNWAFTADAGYYLPVGGISNFGAVPVTFGVMYRFY
jgi:hypothetical protein